MISHWLLAPNLHFLRRVLRGDEPRANYMRFARDIVNWTVPPEVQATILSLGHRVAGFDISRNLELKDRHRDRKRCFVFGNGPSLKDIDLRLFRGEITIAANSFYKHPQADLVDLKYLCCGDPITTKDEPNCVEWHRTIEQRLPNTALMLHPFAKSLTRKYGLYRNHRVYHYHHGVSVNNPDLVHFDFMKPLNVGHTTGSRLCIPLAIYLGCTEIVLLGFDANWMADYRGQIHFYTHHEQFPEHDSTATDPRWPRYADQLINALRDFEAHEVLAKKAHTLGIRIVNAGETSLLDAYPRVRYAEYMRQIGIV